MTTSPDTPITAAAKIRQYHEALERRDILAVEIQADAEIFRRRQSGTPRCEHVGFDEEPDADDQQRYPCCEDADFMVTNFSPAALGDPFHQPVTASQMRTRTLCRNHAALNAVTHHGWIYSAPLEADFPLSQTRPAALFQRIRSGIPRCEYRPYPCTMMGVFAVSSDHDPRLLTISCRQHLLSVAPTKCESVPSLGENLTKHACRFQELRRLIGNQPATADVHNQEIKELHRRLRPNNHYSNPDCPHRRRRP